MKKTKRTLQNTAAIKNHSLLLCRIMLILPAIILFSTLFACKTPPEPEPKPPPEKSDLPMFHLLSPADGAALPDSSPILKWSQEAETGAAQYEVWLDGEKIATVDTGITHFSEIKELEWETGHEWYIVALDTAGLPKQSEEVFTFTVTRAPVLTCPGLNSTCDPILEFRWEAYWYADKWEIIIDDDEDFSSPVISTDAGFEKGYEAGLYGGDIFGYSREKGITIHRPLLQDSQHYYEIDSEQYDSPKTGPDENWSSAGAGTLFYDTDTKTWYTSFRNRAPRDNPPPNDGYSWELWKHHDNYLRTPWIKVWEVPAAPGISIQGVCLRKYDNIFYYYFCDAQDGAVPWTIRYVSADTTEAIGEKLKDPSAWKSIMSGITKDPIVYKLNDNKYYMIIQGDTAESHYAMFRSSTPGFDSYQKVVVDMHRPYGKRYKADDQNPGTIYYDQGSEKYFYWGTSRHGSDIFWFWTSSYDLMDWKLVRRYKVFKWYKLYTTARYQSICETDKTIAILMEWDDDRDYGHGLFIWEYSKQPAPTRAFTVKEPLSFGQYYWKVRGYTGDTPAPFSAVGTFYVQ